MIRFALRFALDSEISKKRAENTPLAGRAKAYENRRLCACAFFVCALGPA